MYRIIFEFHLLLFFPFLYFKVSFNFLHTFLYCLFIFYLIKHLQWISNLLFCSVRNMDLISLFCVLVSGLPELFEIGWVFFPLIYVSHYLVNFSSLEKFLFSCTVQIWFLISLFFSYFHFWILYTLICWIYN